MALLGILEGGGGVRELLLEISACHAIEFDLLASSFPGDRARDDDGQIAGERTIPGNVVVRLRAKPFEWRPGPLGHDGNDGGVQGRTASMFRTEGQLSPLVWASTTTAARSRFSSSHLAAGSRREAHETLTSWSMPRRAVATPCASLCSPPM